MVIIIRCQYYLKLLIILFAGNRVWVELFFVTLLLSNRGDYLIFILLNREEMLLTSTYIVYTI